MVPDQDCVPGLDRAVTVREYAHLKGLSEAQVLTFIQEFKIRKAKYFRGQWFIEAPRNCEARLAQLRGEQPTPRKDKANVPRKGKANIPALEDKEFWALIEREATSYDTPTDTEQNVMLERTEPLHGPQPEPEREREPERLMDQTKSKTALWAAGCVVALLIGIGSCSGSYVISNDLVSSIERVRTAGQVKASEFRAPALITAAW